MYTSCWSVMIQAVDEPLALVLDWPSAKTFIGSIKQPTGTRRADSVQLAMSSLAYAPASIPRNRQPPTPSATPSVCFSAQMK